MAKNFIVYQSRNRITGTLMQTLDLRHAEAPDKFVKEAQKTKPGARYAARCVEHNEVALFEEHYPAGRAIAHPLEWCQGCIAHSKAEKPKVTEATSEAYVKAFRAELRAKAEKSESRKAARASKSPKTTPRSQTPVDEAAAETIATEERRLEEALA